MCWLRWTLLVLSIALTSCVSGPQPRIVTDQKTEFSPDLRFAVGTISSGVSSGATAEIDVVDLMSEALSTALRDQNRQWDNSAADSYAVINLKVVEYEPGSAFGRWLMPGAGATVLAVEGEITDQSRREILGQIRHERGIYAGGAYTIGGWRTVFSSVAEDIVSSLSQHTGSGGFVVHVDAWLKRSVDIPKAATTSVLIIESVSDDRPEKGRIGERFAAFGVSMGDVYFARSVKAYVAEMIADDLRGAGHTVADAGHGRSVSIGIEKFWLTTETTALYWDIVGEILLSLGVASTPEAAPTDLRRFSCASKERTYVWPTESLFEKVLDSCLLELMHNVRQDPIWQASSQ